MGKGQFSVECIDLILFKLVDFFNMGIRDMRKSFIKKTVKAVVADSCEAASYLVIPTHTRIKSLNTVGNPPFNRAVIAGIKMQMINFI